MVTSKVLCEPLLWGRIPSFIDTSLRKSIQGLFRLYLLHHLLNVTLPVKKQTEASGGEGRGQSRRWEARLPGLCSWCCR